MGPGAISLSQKLADMGNPIDDKLLAVIVLAGLPSEYKPMIMALDSSGAQITSDLVKEKLLQKEVKREPISMTNETAFATRKQYAKNSHKKIPTCYACNEKAALTTKANKSD